MSQRRFWLTAGAISGLVAVAAGAFGAHALKDLPPRYLDVFKTGAQYQMYHALALLAVAWLGRGRWTNVAGWCLLLGTVVFSGSLYVLALTQVDRWGAVTPIGGALFLAGWAALAAAALRHGRAHASSAAGRP